MIERDALDLPQHMLRRRRTKTRGRELLGVVLEHVLAREVAARIGVSASNVSHWCSGRNTPCPAIRDRLQTIYGIPICAWEAQHEK